MNEVFHQDSFVVYRSVLGMVHTNTYLAVDLAAGKAVVVDPAAEGRWIAEQAVKRGWKIEEIWLTHAHFDHITGASGVVDELDHPVSIVLHPDDLSIYHNSGGAPLFGLPEFDSPGEPDHLLVDGEQLSVGGQVFTVLATPGHSPGHVVYLNTERGVAFCGDLVFKSGVGRTDLPGGDWETLQNSIRTRIFTLPPETILFPGHGEKTRVGDESVANPFMNDLI